MRDFSAKDFEVLFVDIIDGVMTKNEAKKTLLEINNVGFSSNVFLGAVKVLKNRMTQVQAPSGAIDVCGTGGDGLHTLNISTAMCFVVAACGVCVAKHGNKAISSKSGSADIFAELGVGVCDDVKVIEKNLREKNLCFLFAPFFHESLKNLAVLRKEIAAEFGVPTIFNYLGPLLNPANVKRQLIGTSRKDTMFPMVETLRKSGSEAVYVVHGFDGMDEITLCDDSYLLRFEDKKNFKEEVVVPKRYGFEKCDLSDLRGGDAAYNAGRLRALLDGEKSAYRDIVLLNSAFALKLAGKVEHTKQGVAMAVAALDSGRAKKVLDDLVAG